MSTILGNPMPLSGKRFSFTYTGTFEYIDDGGSNWRIKFLSSGVFTAKRDLLVDVFLVGGGASGLYSTLPNETPGGGSGYTTTAKSVQLTKDTPYDIVVGAGGGEQVGTAGSDGGKSSALGFEAEGGKKGSGASTQAKGGNGGSGGGGRNKGEGGVDGANGGGINGGTGQGTTTREFGESTGELYATGGGSSESSTGGTPGKENTGNGGSGATGGLVNVHGGSGIVVIRKHKEAAA